MQHHLGIFFTCLLSLAASGCVPATYVEIPALHGCVVDSGGRPVVGAFVQIVRDKDHAELANFRPSEDGTFDRVEQSRFTFQFAGADRGLTTYSVTAIAGGRRSPTTQVTDGLRRWFFKYYDPPLDRTLATLRLQ
jgi:hypothetical protein